MGKRKYNKKLVGQELVGRDKDREITESQNHRMLGVGRDHCGSSSPAPLPNHCY